MGAARRSRTPPGRCSAQAALGACQLPLQTCCRGSMQQAAVLLERPQAGAAQASCMSTWPRLWQLRDAAGRRLALAACCLGAPSRQALPQGEGLEAGQPTPEAQRHTARPHATVPRAEADQPTPEAQTHCTAPRHGATRCGRPADTRGTEAHCSAPHRAAPACLQARRGRPVDSRGTEAHCTAPCRPVISPAGAPAAREDRGSGGVFPGHRGAGDGV